MRFGTSVDPLMDSQSRSLNKTFSTISIIAGVRTDTGMNAFWSKSVFRNVEDVRAVMAHHVLPGHCVEQML